MNRYFVIIALGLIFVLRPVIAGNPDKANNSEGKVIHLTNATFKQKVFNYEKNTQWKYEGTMPAIIDFYANWCGPCKQLSPRLEEIAKEYKGKVIVYKVNTDVERELAQSLGVTSLPTLLFIPVKGQPQAATGALPKESLVQAINEVLKVK